MLADNVARFRGRGELGKASRFSRTALTWLARATLPVVGLVVLFSRPLANYLQDWTPRQARRPLAGHQAL